MKNFLIALGGLCAAAVGLLVLNSRRTPSVDTLAHKLDDAWADHHTIA